MTLTLVAGFEFELNDEIRPLLLLFVLLLLLLKPMLNMSGLLLVMLSRSDEMSCCWLFILISSFRSHVEAVLLLFVCLSEFLAVFLKVLRIFCSKLRSCSAPPLS